MDVKNDAGKILYIPIEIFSRELGGALLLAHEATQRDWKVIIGGKKTILPYLSRFRKLPGIFFLKSIVPGEVHIQNKILAYHHRIVSLDIEGLVPTNGDVGVTLRFSEESINKTDLVFFFGQDYLEKVRRIYPSIKEKAYVTSSPVIDEAKILLSRKTKRTPSKKILIATSCVFANSLQGGENPIRMVRNAISNNYDESDMRTLEQTIQLDYKIFGIWNRLVRNLSETLEDDIEIVLRPHPTENKEYWIKEFRQAKNVSIDRNYNIQDTLNEIDIFIHFNSTSAVTAYIGNIPVIMPYPDEMKKFSKNLTFVKGIGYLTKNLTEVESLIQEFYLNARLKTKSNIDLGPFCYKIDDSNYSSSTRIMDIIEAKFNLHNEKIFEITPSKIYEILRNNYLTFREYILWLSSYLNKKNRKRYRNIFKYSQAKQPKINSKDILNHYKKLGIPTNELGIREVWKNTFLLQKK